jgi:hypothetical protein
MEAYSKLADSAPVELFRAARAEFEELVVALSGTAALAMDHEALEQLVVGRGRELQRRLLQEHLDLREQAERTVEVRGDDGVRRVQTRRRGRRLTSVVGDVVVTRMVYEAACFDYRAPLDATLNLPEESYSHGVRRRAAEAASRSSFDEVVTELESSFGRRIPKRQVEQLVWRAASDVKAFYAEQPLVEESPDQLLVITTDGKGIVMRSEHLREQTRKAAEQADARRHDRPMKRLAPGEKRGRKRMAQLAVVYSVAPFVRTTDDVLAELRPVRDVLRARRPRPVNKQVWASVTDSPEQVINAAFAEAQSRDPEHRRSWVVVVDGSPTQLNLVKKAAKKHRVDVRIIIDFIHVLEYLWGAAHCFHAQTREAEVWVQKRLRMLLDGTLASHVAAGMTRSATLQALKKRRGVDKCAAYLRKLAPYINYAQALALGAPIASGVVEGMCRYLVNDRMDKTGACWSLQGAEAILHLRVLRANDDFDDYWRFHSHAEHKRRHADRYDGPVPDPLTPKQKPTLRRIK